MVEDPANFERLRKLLPASGKRPKAPLGDVPEAKPRRSLADVQAEMSPDLRRSLSAATNVAFFNQPAFYTEMFELDFLNVLRQGQRTALIGKPHTGKSTVTAKIIAASQRTCRMCFSPIIQWRDDWTVYTTDVSIWTPESGVLSEPKCRCGPGTTPDPQRTLLIDAEKQFVPSWYHQNGVDVGDWSRFTDIDVDNTKGEWEGLRISPDARLIILRPSNSDAAYDALLPMIEGGAIDLCVIDSIGLLAIAEDRLTNRVGSRARFLKRLAAQMLGAQITACNAYGAKITVVMVNHFMQGPQSNPHANPNVAVGGQGVKYATDVDLEVYSRVNEALPDDAKRGRAIMRDVTFRVTKDRGYAHQATAECRLFVNDWTADGRVKYGVGQTDDPERILAMLREGEDTPEGDPDLWRVERSGSSPKCYWVAGRPFKKLRDITAFLRRRDVGRLLRFVLFARQMPAAQRPMLDATAYVLDKRGNPLLNMEDPLFKLVEKYSAQTGVGLLAAAKVTWTLDDADIGTAASDVGGSAPKPAESKSGKRSGKKNRK